MFDDIVIGGRIQVRVIWALMMREIHTRFGRENIGFLWLVAEPALFAVGVATMWSMIRPAHDHGIGVVAFVITGYIPLVMWRSCVFRAIKAFEANGSLLFHRQVTPLDFILVRSLLEMYGTVLAFLAVGGGACLLGYLPLPYDVGLVLLGWGAVALFSLACALILAGLSEMSDFVERLVGAVTYLALPLSGAFGMVDWVPPKYQHVLLYSPMIHGFEMLRGGWFGPSIHVHYDLVYVGWINAVLILIGLLLCRAARPFIQVQ